jgi:outer membrane lipoprotein SlyB
MKISKLLVIPLVFAAIGCASYRPVVDENEHYESVGSTRAEADIDACMAKADRYLETHKSDRMLKEAGRGAAGGAIVGGLIGALTGDAGKALGGAAIGAGIGATSRAADVAAKDKLTPDELKQRYVSNCLKRKKYVVIGWK